jgi:hypothetical protein
MQPIFNEFKNNYERLTATLQDRQKTNLYLKKSLFYLVLFLILYGIGSLLPEGFDWRIFFKVSNIPSLWTPWTVYVTKLLAPFGYGIVFALTVLGIAIRAHRYKRSPYPIALAILSLPTIWVFFLGNLDGLVLFGMLFMPVGIPLVLMKPQVAAFALLARKDWFIAAAVWGLLSIIIWGFWPLNWLVVTSPEWKLEWTQDITLFPWGLLVGLPLLWFSRRDQDLLMAAGTLITPHLFPYHFIMLMPSLARMRWYWMLITWAVSWTPLLSNWLGPWAWHFGNLMSLCFWFGIYLSEREVKRVKIQAKAAPAAA